MILIHLSAEECDRYEEVANRQCNAKIDGIREKDSDYHRNQNLSDKSDRALPHRIGMLGSVAYGKHMGLFVDEKVFETHGDKEDFHNVEVKTSTWMGAGVELKIKVSEYNRKSPRKYVLARIDARDTIRVALVGEISRDKFDKAKRLKNYGNQDCWVIGAKELDPIRKASKKSRPVRRTAK